MTGSRPRSLVEDAYSMLREGPQPAARVAARVLGLEGNPAVAAQTVQTLLGADSRFTVTDGVWSLVADSTAVGAPLRDLDYAVVDVETTGGPYSAGHRIVEIAVVQVRGGRIQEQFRSLVNPGRRIPPSVFRLNGIDDALVAGAPYFDQVAEPVLEAVEGRVFVAHNVGFDWTVLQSELGESVGRARVTARVCTVRLAKGLLPGLKRRTLDVLADHFGIPIFERHRAHGDAMATARVLLRLLDLAEQRGLVDLAALDAWLDGMGNAGST